MGFDPFYTSKESLETSIVDLEQTVADYRRLQNHDTSTAQWQLGMIEHRYNEAIQLKNLLDQSCKKAAEDPARFGITPEELRSRQAYIERAAQRLKMVHTKKTIRKDPKIDGCSLRIYRSNEELPDDSKLLSGADYGADLVFQFKVQKNYQLKVPMPGRKTEDIDLELDPITTVSDVVTEVVRRKKLKYSLDAINKSTGLPFDDGTSIDVAYKTLVLDVPDQETKCILPGGKEGCVKWTINDKGINSLLHHVR